MSSAEALLCGAHIFGTGLSSLEASWAVTDLTGSSALLITEDVLPDARFEPALLRLSWLAAVCLTAAGTGAVYSCLCELRYMLMLGGGVGASTVLVCKQQALCLQEILWQPLVDPHNNIEIQSSFCKGTVACVAQTQYNVLEAAILPIMLTR